MVMNLYLLITTIITISICNKFPFTYYTLPPYEDNYHGAYYGQNGLSRRGRPYHQNNYGNFPQENNHKLRRPNIDHHSIPFVRKDFPDYDTKAKRSSKGSSSFWSSLKSVIDPFGLFTSLSPEQIKKPPTASYVASARNGVARDGYNDKEDLPTTTSPPLTVFFPEGTAEDCQDFQKPGFNTFSFLSYLFSIANIVGLIANNVNNNLLSNNNNNNDDNNNLLNFNSANTNSNQGNDNAVMIPAGMGRRKKRNTKSNFVSSQINQISKEQRIASLIAMEFLKVLQVAIATSQPDCALRNICEVNEKSIGCGLMGEMYAEVFSEALAIYYPQPLPVTVKTFLEAAEVGRTKGKCSNLFPSCTEKHWKEISLLLEEFSMPQLIIGKSNSTVDYATHLPLPESLMITSVFKDVVNQVTVS